MKGRKMREEVSEAGKPGGDHGERVRRRNSSKRGWAAI